MARYQGPRTVSAGQFSRGMIQGDEAVSSPRNHLETSSQGFHSAHHDAKKSPPSSHSLCLLSSRCFPTHSCALCLLTSVSPCTAVVKSGEPLCTHTQKDDTTHRKWSFSKSIQFLKFIIFFLKEVLLISVKREARKGPPSLVNTEIQI